MPSEIERYRLLLRDLSLTDEQERDLIGVVECIVENLLDSKYMLRKHRHEQGRFH